ncbi:unnamed protein product [Schistocephalus solidus]|uniref:IRF tryptophan pentad repeat domain-containing protein n=1 Tax=Schistocephalus solidus TaxID=70667 RepID=A0A183T544_SCHSO|nr:unnamed protein product [Schistocephalus solidus]
METKGRQVYSHLAMAVNLFSTIQMYIDDIWLWPRRFAERSDERTHLHYRFFYYFKRQGQGELSKGNQNIPCCCGRYGTGSVEIVKIGEGPPLTLADLQSHGLHGGGFPLIEDADWPQEQRKPVWKSSAPAYSEKKTPVNGYGNWSQKKYSVHEQPSCVPRNDMAQPGGALPSSSYRFHAVPSNVPTGLVTTTAQTAVNCMQQPVTSQPPYSLPWQQQQQQQPMGCSGHCCGQCFAPPPPNDAWNSPGGIMNARKIRDERKFSLPPASHHSTEQRTSYREHRFH